MPFFMGKLLQIRKDAVWAPTRLGKKRDIQKSVCESGGAGFYGGEKNAACTAERFTEMRKLHKNQPPNEKLFEDLQETKMLEEIRGRK